MHWPKKIHTRKMLRTRPHNFSNVPTARPFLPGLGRELVTERVTKPRKTKIPPSGEGGGRYLKKNLVALQKRKLR